jgi:predicted membrane protein
MPSDVAFRVRATAGTGDVRILGDHRSGFGVDQRYVTPGYETSSRRLDLDLSTGMGQVEVTR